MNEAYDIVRKNCCVRKEMDKKRWDAGRMFTPLEIGDRVLIQNKRERGGPGKLRSYWEQKVYIITDVKGSQNVVYEVREEGNRKSKPRVVHRNMLMSVNDDFVLSENEEKVEEKKSEKEKKNEEKKHKVVKNDENKMAAAQKKVVESDSDDSEEERGFYPSELQGLRTEPVARRTRSNQDDKHVHFAVSTDVDDMSEAT